MVVDAGTSGAPTAGENIPTLADLVNVGRFGDAAALLGQRISQDLRLLGSLQHRQGDLSAAIATYRTGLDLRETAATHAALAFSLHDSGRLAEAEHHAATSLRLDPALLSGYLAAANTAFCRRRFPDALRFLDAAEARHSEEILILVLRMSFLRQMSRLEDAEAVRDRALILKPDNPGLWQECGWLEIAQDRDDAATVAFRRAEAVSQHPGRIIADQTVLRIQNGEPEAGGFARALAVADRANVGSILYDRAMTTRMTAGDAEVAVMEQHLADAQSWNDQVMLRYGLANIYLNDAEFDCAFGHLHAASAMMRDSFDYRVADDEQRMLAFADAVPPGIIAQRGPADATVRIASEEAPIFVVGMPRSGTSLVEQILASHPDVHGLGEPAIVASLLRAADDGAATACSSPAELREMGRSYLARARKRAGNDRRTVDKRTDNFLYLGPISLMLPGARIIHCRRDPMDVGLSCYSKLFSFGHEYSYTLPEIGAYHTAYAALMRRWRALLPQSQLLDLDYEDLVGAPDNGIRRILDFCGLPWNESCLRFFETRRPVRSSSLTQVRMPVYTASVSRWKACMAFLEPLRDALALADRPGPV